MQHRLVFAAFACLIGFLLLGTACATKDGVTSAGSGGAAVGGAGGNSQAATTGGGGELPCDDLTGWFGDELPAEVPTKPDPTALGKTQYVEIEWKGRKRYMAIFLPASYDPQNPAAVIMHFHGGNNTVQGTIAKRRWLVDRALAQGIIYVIPQGLNKVWNAAHCCGGAFWCGVDDIGAVEAMVALLVDGLAVDAKRIYATGHSNGGMLTHRIGAELPHVFAAIAPGAASIGGIPKDATTDDILKLAPPKAPIPVLLYHGKKDGSVKFNGGPNDTAPTARVDLSFAESTAYWVQANGCSGDPQASTVGSITASNYTCTEANVQTVVFSQLGHAYPDYPEDVPDYDFSEGLFQFFAQNPKP